MAGKSRNTRTEPAKLVSARTAKGGKKAPVGSGKRIREQSNQAILDLVRRVLTVRTGEGKGKEIVLRARSKRLNYPDEVVVLNTVLGPKFGLHLKVNDRVLSDKVRRARSDAIHQTLKREDLPVFLRHRLRNELQSLGAPMLGRGQPSDDMGGPAGIESAE